MVSRSSFPIQNSGFLVGEAEAELGEPAASMTYRTWPSSIGRVKKVMRVLFALISVGDNIEKSHATRFSLPHRSSDLKLEDNSPAGFMLFFTAFMIAPRMENTAYKSVVNELYFGR